MLTTKFKMKKPVRQKSGICKVLLCKIIIRWGKVNIRTNKPAMTENEIEKKLVEKTKKTRK